MTATMTFLASSVKSPRLQMKSTASQPLLRGFIYLSVGAFLVRWVQEDPSIDQGAVHVSHHGSHVPGTVGG